MAKPDQSPEALKQLTDAAEAWHKFQGRDNINNLYRACDRYFGSNFNPAEYDDVE